MCLQIKRNRSREITKILEWKAKHSGRWTAVVVPVSRVTVVRSWGGGSGDKNTSGVRYFVPVLVNCEKDIGIIRKTLPEAQQTQSIESIT